MSKYFVAPASQKSKHKASKYGFTLSDMVFLFTITIFTIGFCFIWYAIFEFGAMFYVLSVITSAFLITLMIWSMLGSKKNNLGRRNYIEFSIRLKNSFKNKDVLIHEITKVLPMISFDDQDNMIFNIGDREKVNVKVYEVLAEDLALLSEAEEEKHFKALYRIYKSLENNIKLVIIDEKANLDKNIAYFKNLHKNEKDAHLKSKIEVYIKMLDKQAKSLVSGSQKHFYFLSCSKGKEEPNRNFFTSLSLNMNIQEVTDKDKKLAVVNGIYSSWTNENNNYSSKFKNHFNYAEQGASNIDFKSKYYFANGEYHSIMNVYTYPLKNDASWFNHINKINNISVVQDINPIPAQFMKENLERSRLTIQANTAFITKKMESLDHETNLAHLEEMMTELVTESELCLLKVSTTIIVHGKTLEELNKNSQEFISHMRQNGGYDINTLDYEQAFALSKILSFSNGNNKTFLWNEITSRALVASYPFSSSTLNDEEGIFLGWNKRNKNQIVVDVRKIDPKTKRNSGSGSICGTTGSGKTFMLSYLTSMWLLQGSKVRIFDPLKDYYGLQKYFKGKVIDIGTGQSGKINILECFNASDKEVDLETHANFVLTLIKKLKPSIGEIEASVTKALQMLFEQEKSKIQQKKEWPTLTDFKKVVYNKITSKPTKEFKIPKKEDTIPVSHFQKLRDLAFDLSEGIYAKLWNGKTTFDIKNEKVVIFDTTTLENNEQAIQDVQMSIIFNFLDKELWENAKANAKHKTRNWMYVIVDEAHRFINDKQPIASAMIERMAREIRHFQGSLYLATQSFADFTSESAKKILSLGMYQFAKSINKGDIKSYAEMFSGYRSVTEEELKQIESLTIQETVLNIKDIKTLIEMPNLSEIKELWENDQKPTN